MTEGPQRRRRKTASGRDGRGFTKDLAQSWRRELPDIECAELLVQIYIMRLGRMLDSAYDRLCRETVGISGSDMRVLFALRRAGAPYSKRPTDLFRALLVTSGAITKQVDRLQDAGFVVRLPDPSFNGGYLIQLTKKGKSAAEQTVRTVATRGLMSEASRAISRKDLHELLRVCETILVAIETSHPEA
jgi:DNA-binding MarR family transcriptional regulator